MGDLLFPKSPRCWRCGKTFWNFRKLREHLDTCPRLSPLELVARETCRVCGIPWYNNRRYHNRRHGRVEE